MQSSQMRWCPNCETERDLSELFCHGCPTRGLEPWPLGNEPIQPRGWRPDIPSGHPPAEPSPRVCPNGHPITAGDWMCPTCNADIPAGDAGISPPGLAEPEAPPFGLPPRAHGTEPAPQPEPAPIHQPEPEPPLHPEILGDWRLDRRLGRPGDIPERFARQWVKRKRGKGYNEVIVAALDSLYEREAPPELARRRAPRRTSGQR